MVEEMLKSFSRLFLNILSISLENIKPMGNFFLQAGDFFLLDRQCHPRQIQICLGWHWRSRTYHISKMCRAGPYQKHLSYCHTEVVPRSFGLKSFPLAREPMKLLYQPNGKRRKYWLFCTWKIFRRIEFCLNTKCLVSSHSYTLLFQECIMKAKRLFHGIRFSVFYEPNSVQVALKIPY